MGSVAEEAALGAASPAMAIRMWNTQRLIGVWLQAERAADSTAAVGGPGRMRGIPNVSSTATALPA